MNKSVQRGMIAVLGFSLMCSVGVASAQEEGLHTLTFDHHRLEFSETLANQVRVTFLNELIEDEAGVSYPPHIRVSFEQALLGTVDIWYAGNINFYRTEDFVDHPFEAQLEQLESLLAEQPDLTTEETLPTFHPFMDAASISLPTFTFFTRADYFETDSYHGITFTNGRMYNTNANMILSRYSFLALSADGEWVMSGQFTQDEVQLPAGIELIEDEAAYGEAVREAFNALPSDALSPATEVIEQLLTSVTYLGDE